MNAIQHYEVTMMRKYKNDEDLSFCQTGDGSCFVAEFSLQSNIQPDIRWYNFEVLP